MWNLTVFLSHYYENYLYRLFVNYSSFPNINFDLRCVNHNVLNFDQVKVTIFLKVSAKQRIAF